MSLFGLIKNGKVKFPSVSKKVEKELNEFIDRMICIDRQGDWTLIPTDTIGVNVYRHKKTGLTMVFYTN